jgi:Amt family ammonium transporter
MILTGVFAKDLGLYYGHTHTFFYHMLALVIVSVFSFGGHIYFISSLTR